MRFYVDTSSLSCEKEQIVEIVYNSDEVKKIINFDALVDKDIKYELNSFFNTCKVGDVYNGFIVMISLPDEGVLWGEYIPGWKSSI